MGDIKRKAAHKRKRTPRLFRLWYYLLQRFKRLCNSRALNTNRNSSLKWRAPAISVSALHRVVLAQVIAAAASARSRAVLAISASAMRRVQAVQLSVPAAAAQNEFSFTVHLQRFK